MRYVGVLNWPAPERPIHLLQTGLRCIMPTEFAFPQTAENSEGYTGAKQFEE